MMLLLFRVNPEPSVELETKLSQVLLKMSHFSSQINEVSFDVVPTPISVKALVVFDGKML